MKKSTSVRIKGANWESLASDAANDRQAVSVSPLAEKASAGRSGMGSAKSMLLDLAVRHFRGLQLTTAEAKRLASGLRRCIKGEAIDVGPVGPTGRVYNFRRKANAISIRVGEGCIRLPLDAAKALIEPLRGAVRPTVFANAG